VLAYDYPLIGAFWTMLWFFLWILWFFLLFRVIIDIFRDHTISGWAKAAWLIFIIIVPFLGVFVYLIARGSSMAQRDQDQAKAQEQAFRSYVQDAAGSGGGGGGTASELSRLAQLKDQGVITDAEFQQQKAKLLA
jgi:Short C-terminal domain/Phospholipase_D-nuclease N-terminal